MDWLQQVDANLFLWFNLKWVNPVFDWLMPQLAGNKLFFPVVVLVAGILIWKGKTRGLICVVLLALIVALGDGMVCRPLKHLIARPRPFIDIEQTRLLIGAGGSGSMPSSHAANWFAATMVLFIYYRRSLWVILPGAVMVGFSRIYDGVHYPSDVLTGAILGAGYAAAGVWSVDELWRWAGRKWFPLWWEKLPSLMNPRERQGTEDFDEPAIPPPRGQAAGPAPHASIDAHWLRLGYVVIFALLVFRLFYIASDTIQLSEDEAYQWTWSKHLALSYYSKPPLIAYTQFLGTSLWGDNAFGVRFFSPLIAAVLGIIMLRFFARHVNARAGFFLLLIVSTTLLLAVGSVLMTVDPLSVLFWSAAMFAGWRAVQPNAGSREWLWVGLWMGLGFLSKYTQIFQLLCWILFFVLWKPARVHLRKPGPYLALLVNLFAATPVLIWNSQNHWITVRHVAESGGAGQPWGFTLKYLGDFIGLEFLLLNPVWFVAAVWAAIVFWRRSRNNPLLVYFFSMGVPVVFGYFLQSFRSRILPNWIAPSILPLFCLMVIYWDTRFRLGTARIKPWLASGLGMGLVMVVLGHDSDLVYKIAKVRVPVNLDPLHRVREWDDVAQVVGKVRRELLEEGKPVFIITDHYGMTGQLSFYLPEAREAVQKEPLVYFKRARVPMNQFYFWAGYSERKGQNAIYFVELDRNDPRSRPPPATVLEDFESVEDLGIRKVFYNDHEVLRYLQFYACRNLK